MNNLKPALNSSFSLEHLSRRGTIGMVVLGAVIVLWTLLAPLSGAIMAQGIVKVDKEHKLVQHLEGGIVKDILVTDGQYVQQGQALLTIADTKVDASVGSLRNELDSEWVRKARLQAERDDEIRMEIPKELKARIKLGELGEVVRIEQHLFSMRRVNLQQKVKLLRSQVEEVSNEIAGLSEQIQSGQHGLELMQQELQINEQMLGKSFVSKTRILELQRQVTDYQTRRESYATEQAKARQKKLELELQIVRLREDYMQQAATELEDVIRKVNDLKNRLHPSMDAQERQVVRAPVSGKIVNLKIHTAGGVIGAGATLMEIVPDNQDLIIEAQIAVEDIDELHLNMPAEIRLSAYHQRTSKMLLGNVIYISADRLSNETSPKPYYAVMIKAEPLAPQAVENAQLVVGMPAEVFIKTTKRTVVEYMFAPIVQSLRRGMRES